MGNNTDSNISNNNIIHNYRSDKETEYRKLLVNLTQDQSCQPNHQVKSLQIPFQSQDGYKENLCINSKNLQRQIVTSNTSNTNSQVLYNPSTTYVHFGSDSLRQCSVRQHSPSINNSQFQSIILNYYEYPKNYNQSVSSVILPQSAYNCQSVDDNQAERLWEHFAQTNIYEQQQSEETMSHDWVESFEKSFGEAIQGKRRRSRQTYTNEQTQILENEFAISYFISKPRRKVLAARLNLSDAQIKIWFQNRRMKEKKKQLISPTQEHHVTFEGPTTINANSTMTSSINTQQQKELNAQNQQNDGYFSEFDKYILDYSNYPTVKELLDMI